MLVAQVETRGNDVAGLVDNVPAVAEATSSAGSSAQPSAGAGAAASPTDTWQSLGRTSTVPRSQNPDFATVIELLVTRDSLAEDAQIRFTVRVQHWLCLWLPYGGSRLSRPRCVCVLAQVHNQKSQASTSSTVVGTAVLPIHQLISVPGTAVRVPAAPAHVRAHTRPRSLSRRNV